MLLSSVLFPAHRAVFSSRAKVAVCDNLIWIVKIPHAVWPILLSLTAYPIGGQSLPSKTKQTDVSVLKITPGIDDHKKLLKLYGKSLIEIRPSPPMIDGWTFYRLEGTKTDIQFYFELKGRNRPISTIRVYFNSPNLDSDKNVRLIPRSKAEMGILAGLDERLSLQRASDLVDERLKHGRNNTKTEDKISVEYSFLTGKAAQQRSYRLKLQADERSRLSSIELNQIDP